MRVASGQVVTVGFRVKNAAGVLVDAASTPTSVLYLNGVSTAVVVTVTSDTGAGKYKASWTNGTYSPGDQLRLEVTATVDGVSYSSFVWEATVDEVPATAADIDAARAAIIAQGNSAWVTATGFSTHSASAAATAVRTELATELGRIDVSIASRLAGSAVPANFAALGINASGHISRVTLVDTTTANTDMRGTDGAVLEGSEMTLTSGERSAIAIAVEAALLNDGDGQALVDAIITRIENDLDASDVTVQAIGVAVRDAILDRVLALNHDTAGTVGRILQDTYAAASDLDNRATEARLTKLDRDLAAVADVSNAASTVIAYGDSAWLTASGFSTHDPADVAAAILANPLNKLATDASGRVVFDQAFPANFAALGINASGHVSRVTLVDTTTSNADMRGTDGANTAAPPTADAVRDAILDRVLAGNHEVPGSLGSVVPDLATGLADVIKSGEERTLTRTGKDPVTFTEARTAI